jgi:Uma2 family endonuclease
MKKVFGETPMANSIKIETLTPEEYLQMEQASSVKHEYVGGRIFVMTGGTNNHSAITANLVSIIRNPIKGNNCRVHAADFKVRINAANCFYYPDLVVECGAVKGNSVLTEAPILLAEVVSPSSVNTDRREKAIAYRLLPSVREYLVIHQTRQRVELHRKGPDETWTIFDLRAGSTICLESLPTGPLKFPIYAIYEDTDVPGDRNLIVREASEGEYSLADDLDDDWPEEENEDD